MTIKEILIEFWHGQEKLLLENMEISEETRRQRMGDIQKMIKGLEEKKDGRNRQQKY